MFVFFKIIYIFINLLVRDKRVIFYMIVNINFNYDMIYVGYEKLLVNIV